MEFFVCLFVYQIEGVAYRGRVMVELEMNIGSLPTTRKEEIKIVDQKRIIPFLRRRKYKLFGAFFSATMVDPKGDPVEFEVSIGKRESRFICTCSLVTAKNFLKNLVC